MLDATRATTRVRTCRGEKAMATTSWAIGVDGNFDTASNWTNGVPAAGDTALIAAAGGYTVSSAKFNAMAELAMAPQATLEIDNGAFRVTSGTGTGALAGTITVTNTGQDVGELQLGAKGTSTTFNNTGTIQLILVADLVIAGTATLTGNGQVILDGAGTTIGTGAFDGTLINGSSTSSGQTIAGTGAIGDGALHFVNPANGVINASGNTNPAVSQALDIQTASFTNSGLMTATGTGILFLRSPIGQTASGQIMTSNSGAAIVLDNAAITNGTVSIAEGSSLVSEGGTNTINTNSMTNAGSIQAAGTSTLILNSVANTGTGELVAATSGRIEVAGNAMGGTAVIGAGGEIFFAGPASTNVTFEGNGVLILDDAMNFTGTVFGLTGNPGAAIVLSNIPFADGPIVSPLSADGVFTVTDPATNVVDTIKTNGGGPYIAHGGTGAFVGFTLIST
jgi:hypothetical protein